MTNQEIKTEAHRIRAAAATKHGCDVKTICFIICWNMAKSGEKLPWETEMVEMSDSFKIENNDCCEVKSSLQEDGSVCVEIQTDEYNRRACGKPWIAIVEADGNHLFGSWSGKWDSGEAGVLKITAKPGDIVRQGQKNHRKNRSWSQKYEVCANGSLNNI